MNGRDTPSFLEGSLVTGNSLFPGQNGRLNLQYHRWTGLMEQVAFYR